MPVAVTKKEFESRVSTLEKVLEQFIVSTQRSLNRLSNEMREFKDEMKDFKDEMREFKDEMRDTIQEMKDDSKNFKEEMRDVIQEMKEDTENFKEEMRDVIQEMKEDTENFKQDMRRMKKELDKKWGDLANKLGTFAEDIAAPNIPRIAKDLFGCKKILFHAVRIDIPNPNVEYGVSEFDAVTECEDKVFLLETKSAIRMKYIESLPNLLDQFRYCFPQYKGKQLIPVFASMSIPENIVKKLSKMGFYAMVMGDDNMDIINFDKVNKVIKV